MHEQRFIGEQNNRMKSTQVHRKHTLDDRSVDSCGKNIQRPNFSSNEGKHGKKHLRM